MFPSIFTRGDELILYILKYHLENVANFDYNGWGTCMPKWDAFPEEGVRWDFKSNGDQIIGEEGKIVSKPEYVSKSFKKPPFSNKKASSPSSS